MLSLRLGKSTAPIDIDCSFCHKILPALRGHFMIETSPVNQKSINEYESACDGCYQTIKEAATRLGVPIEWDIEFARKEPGTTGTKLGLKLKEIDG